jgi:hypothetical protein
MNYSELIQLGFKRTDTHDNVHFKMYGFESFFLSKKLTKRHELFWDVLENNQINLIRYESDGYTIKDEMIILDIQTATDLIRMFG